MNERLPAHLGGLDGLVVRARAPMSEHTRFGIGGPADLLVDASTEASLIAALEACREADVPLEMIGDGTNLIVDDDGFRGVILRYRGAAIGIDGTQITVEAGAGLQALVDATIAQGLAGVHTMTGVPGSVGAAVYGNAGAYGRSISQSVQEVRFYNGSMVATFTNAECLFEYRGSVFKSHKPWVILRVDLQFEQGGAAALRSQSDKIRAIRDEKYPPAMRCAGSVFKNLLMAELAPEVRELVPANLVREAKVPAAWFLDQAGVKGMRSGGIHVAEYHANLIYNAGGGTAAELRQVITDCKRRVEDRFGLTLEEEVQYIGDQPL